MAAAGRGLSRGQRDPQPSRADAADVVQQSAPAAAEVEHPSTGLDADLLGDVVVLAPLRLLEGEREVPVVLRAAEVRQLAQTQTDHTIRQRVGEVEILPLSHDLRRAACRTAAVAAGLGSAYQKQIHSVRGLEER